MYTLYKKSIWRHRYVRYYWHYKHSDSDYDSRNPCILRNPFHLEKLHWHVQVHFDFGPIPLGIWTLRPLGKVSSLGGKILLLNQTRQHLIDGIQYDGCCGSLSNPCNNSVHLSPHQRQMVHRI